MYGVYSKLRWDCFCRINFTSR